jgi:hypothetical protein
MLPGASLEAVVDALRHFPAPQWQTLLRRLRAQKVTVNVDLARRRPQPRRTVEQLLNDVQRMPTTAAGGAPLKILIREVRLLAPPRWKASVRSAQSRLRS